MGRSTPHPGRRAAALSVLLVLAMSLAACGGGGGAKRPTAALTPAARCQRTVSDTVAPVARVQHAAVQRRLDEARRSLPAGPAADDDPAQNAIAGSENEMLRHDKAFEAFPELVCARPRSETVLGCMRRSAEAAQRFEAGGTDDLPPDPQASAAVAALRVAARRAGVVFESVSFCVKEGILGRYPDAAPIEDPSFRACAAGGLAAASAYAGLSSCAPLLHSVESQLPTTTTTTTTTAPA